MIYILRNIKAFLAIVLSLICLSGYSQKEGNIWYFGTFAGLDFNTSPPTALNNSKMNGYEGCASISDTSGSLLFYTDGVTIWNKRHAVMQNGTGLLGGNSSAQSAVVIPYPTRDSLYFVFTVPQNGQTHGLRYSIVNMNLDTGNGGVTSVKNVNLFSTTREKLTAVKHANGKDYWVIIQEWNSNAYRAYQVTDTGVALPPTRTVIGTSSSGWYTLKSNPQGNKIATTHAITNPRVNVFDFNNSTGVLSNSKTLNIPGNCLELYGCEFSPNGKVLYAGIYNCSRVIYQWNLDAGNDTAINRSRVKLDSGSNIGVGTFQLASDGKIYISRDQQTYLSVINYPDVLDTCCAYRQNGVSLGSNRGRFGLPTIMQSYFAPQNPLGFKFLFNNQCIGDTITVKATGDSIKSVKFLYGSQVDSGATVKYVFNQIGTYEIAMVTERNIATSCSNSFSSDTIRQKITIGMPKKVFIEDSTVCNSFRVITSLDTIGYSSFKWSIDSIKSDSFIITEQGKYWVDITDTMSCSYSDTLSIQQYSNPDAKIEFDSIHCNGSLWDIFNKSLNDINTKYYFKILDSTYSFTDSMLSIQILDTGRINAVFISESRTCQDSISFTIHSIPTPESNFSIKDKKQCFRGHLFNTDNNTSSFNYNLQYIWNFGNGDTSMSFEPNFSYAIYDTFIVSLYVENNYKCNSISYDTATVHPNPVAGFEVNDTLACFRFQGFDFNSTASINKGEIQKFIWDLGNGKFDSTEHLNQVVYDSIGEYIITQVVVSENSCSDTTFNKIYVKQQPMAQYNFNTLEHCLKLNHFELKDTTTHNTPYTWVWQVPFLNINDSVSNSLSLSFSEAGQFDFSLIVLDEYGCRDTSIGEILVHPQSDLVFLTDTACLRDSISLRSMASVSSGNIVSQLWDLGNGQIRSGEQFAYLYPTTGTYDITLETITDKDCKDTLTRQNAVLIRPLPAPLISATSPICENLQLSISNNTVDTGQHAGADYYLDWYGSQQLVNDNTFQRLPLDTGVQHMNFFAINQFGCRDSTTLNYSIIPEPKADFFFPFRLQCLRGNIFEPKNLTDSFNYPISFFWDFGGTNTFDIFEPVISFPDTGIYPMYMRVVNSFGCESIVRDTLKIDFFPIPTINYTLDIDSQCLFGNSFVFTNNSAISEGAFETRVGFAGVDSVLFGDTLAYHVPRPGLFHIDIFINSDLQCKDTVSAEIRVWEMPEAAFLVNASTGCEGQSTFGFKNQTIAQPTSLDYVWRYENITNIDSVQDFTHLFQNEGIYEVQLEAITEQNCRDTARQILIVNPVPKPIAMANSDEQCFNNQVYDFYSNTLLNNGDYESFWTLPEFGEIHADSLFDLRFSSIGIKNIKYKAVSDSGCADSMLFAIEVYASPQASFVLDTNASCLKYNEITAQNTTNILAGTVSQYWYKDEFELISTDENLAYRFADSGWFWVRLKALSGEGCADTVSRQVRLFQEPVAQFTAVFMDSCFYDHELFVNSSAFGFNGDIRSDFELSDYSAFNNTKDFSYKFTTFDTFFVQQIVTDEVGCADTTTQQVIVRPQPLARINADIIQPCLRVNQFDFRDSTLANGVAYVRTWELVDENHFSSDSILKYAYSQDGDKTIYLSADGPFGCSTKDSFYVKVLPKNELHYLLSDNSYCFKEQELSFEYVGEVDFADLDGLWWEFGDGITETTESGQKLFANTGLFASQLISLNEFGCYDTLDFAIEIKPNPIADFELNSSLWCFNNQAIVFDSKASLSFGNIARYEWDFDDGTSSNFARVDDKKYNASGGYYIRHVVEGDNECRDTSFKDILIVKNPEASHTSLSYDECFKGNEFTIENTSMVYDNISKTYWTLPSEGVLDSGQLFTFSLSKAGNAQFRLVIIDELGCSDTTTGEITVHPQANIDFESDTVCLLQENTMRSLSTIDSGTIVSHDWLLGDGTIASGESISHTFSNSGSYTITHYTSSNFGCKDTLEKVGIAVVRELPTVSFTYEKILDSLRITGYQFTNGSTGNEPLSHNWTFDMFGFSSDRNPYFEFSDTGLTYITLEVTDVFGCQDTNSQLIRIIPSNNIYIPSAFSPNGDGLNDVFKPEGMPYSIRYKMEIYNRWGELLFVSNDLNKGWDGTYKGVLLNQDIFIYKIVLLDINNNFVNKKGTVTLLR